MKPILQDRFAPITEADLQAFEREIRHKLPEDYRVFLLRNNGGTFCDDVCDGENHRIDGFHGLNVPFEYADLRLAYNSLLGAIPGDQLPIANSPLGDTFFLTLSGPTRGNVIVWLHDIDNDDPYETELCAESFEAFFSSLRVEHEVDVEAMESPLRAVYENDSTEFERLLHEGVDVNWSDADGCSLLGHAAYRCRPAIIQLLLQHGADLAKRDKLGNSPAFLAVNAHSVDCLQLLINGGADVNEVNKKGESLLILAVKYGATRSALTLIDAGADVNFVTKKGETALTCCRNSGEIELVAPRLKKAGATR